MLKIGLTGGVASGKSAAARRFAALGVPVVDADDLAREAVAPGSDGLRAVVEAFGPDILAADGSLDRRRMRQRVFGDSGARRRLEAIVHPRVRVLLDDRLAALQAPYAIVAVPLLVESGLAAEMDRVLVVDAPEQLQIRRLMERDGETESGAQRMLEAQAGRSERLAAADDIIVNDGTLEQLDASVRHQHRRYLALAGTG